MIKNLETRNNYQRRRTIYSLFLLVTLIAGLPQIAFSQRKKTTISTAPRWNIAELGFGSPVKISLQTEMLPEEFGGHNFVEIFANLEKTLGSISKDATQSEQTQQLKNKKLVGDLTIDDYFILKVEGNSDVRGLSADGKRQFEATTFQLRQEKRIEADRDIFDGCFMVRGGDPVPRGNSADDFIKPIKNETIWTNSYLLLNTVKPIYNRKTYKGKRDTNPNIPANCRWTTVIPNPQAQYELAFTTPQPFDLAESTTANFSFADYEYHAQKGIGVIAWELLDEQARLPSEDWATPLFLVKLKPPFFKTETLETDDLIEKKKFKMFAKTFYVDIEAIWFVSWKTGKVIKKIGKM